MRCHGGERGLERVFQGGDVNLMLLLLGRSKVAIRYQYKHTELGE